MKRSFLAWLLGSIATLTSAGFAVAQDQEPSCACTIMIRWNGALGVWQHDNCAAVATCLWGEGWCEPAAGPGGYIHCSCTLSENEERFPSACYCTARVNAAAVPPVLCVELNPCTDSPLGDSCNESHWLFPWANWNEACRCNG